MEAAEDRRRSKEHEASPSMQEEPLVPLTKEGCLAYFRKHGYLDVNSPGSLWGMYHWAANLGRAKFLCDFEVVNDDYSFLDAYD